jgi:undecaprenyl-diphosphatase
MNILEIDYQVLKIFNQPLLPYLNTIFLFVIYSVYIFLVFLAYVFLKNKNRGRLFHLITACLIGYLFVLGLKYFINRPRPCETHADIDCIIRKSDPSFPSAHSFIAFLSIYFIPKGFSKTLKYLSYIYLAILIPFGSMYIGVHYPLDVLFGLLIGIITPFVISEKLSNKILTKFI